MSAKICNKRPGLPVACCGRSGCENKAIRKQGRQLLCPMHYRFGQMRSAAKRHGKAIPTHEQLESLLTIGLTCMDCGEPMVWLGVHDQQRVITLQHYRDGSFGFVCRSCNTRHAFMDGDSYRDMPKDHKQCPQCNLIKPLTEYSVDRGRKGKMKIKSWCKRCSSKSHTQWQRNNREYYNQKQREWRAKNAVR